MGPPAPALPVKISLALLTAHVFFSMGVAIPVVIDAHCCHIMSEFEIPVVTCVSHVTLRVN